MRTFKGFMPALVTPFGSDGATERDHMHKLTAYHLGKGVAGFYVCGSTGQGIYTSVENRKLAAEAVIAEAAGSAPVIVHVGSMVVSDAVELARHAASHGAAAISSVLPPTYTVIDSLVEYFTAISNAAPELPLLPYLLSTQLDVLQLMERLCAIPTVAGTKYTGPNMDEMMKIAEMGRAISASGSWTVFAGMDQQCVFAAMAGADGNIGSSLNVIPGAYRRIWELVAADRHREAMEFQIRATAVIDTLRRYRYAAALRHALTMLGVPCGPPCLPELPLDASRTRALEADLEKVGFAELAAL